MKNKPKYLLLKFVILALLCNFVFGCKKNPANASDEQLTVFFGEITKDPLFKELSIRKIDITNMLCLTKMARLPVDSSLQRLQDLMTSDQRFCERIFVDLINDPQKNKLSITMDDLTDPQLAKRVLHLYQTQGIFYGNSK